MEEHELDKQDPWVPFLAAAAFAVCSTFHTIMQATPSQLVFGRDMLLPMQFQADWALIRERKQRETECNNKIENWKRIEYEYKEGDKVLLKIPRKVRKHRKPHEGPYKIMRVYANGTIRILRGSVSDRVNIRCVVPYFKNEGR